MIRTQVVPARGLDPGLTRRWAELQASNPGLASPYFSPGFTEAVGAARDDAQVAVLSEGEEVVGFLPFQRRGRSQGVPVGSLLSDFQAIVCRPDFSCDPREVVRACGLACWDFDHLLASQTWFEPFHRNRILSPVMDLSGGFAAYLASIPKDPEVGRRRRKLEREVGPLRFSAHASDERIYATFQELKSEQYRRTSHLDIFSIPWVRAVVEGIFRRQSEDFAGMLATLHAGDQLVAVNMGMRSREVWHPWFPAYVPAFSKYSPGITLFFLMAEAAPGLGIRSMDLGKGDSYYKGRLANAQVPIAEGSVERPSWFTMRRRAQRGLRRWAKSSPLARPARWLARKVRPWKPGHPDA
jgi:CelD/BcsL family acetyltransferase involved in cellulose biosynthesis